MFFKLCSAATLWMFAADAWAAGHLTVAMDRNHQLFVCTTLDHDAVSELSFGLDQDGLKAFVPIDERGLEALVAADADLDAEVTIWVDPNARPMAWPAGWRADSDLLDPTAYVVQLLGRAHEKVVPGAPRTEQPPRMLFLPVPFPPPVPLRIGSR